MIFKVPDPILRSYCEVVSDFEQAKTVAKHLIQELNESQRAGVGLAANQIGKLLRIFVIDLKGTLRDASFAQPPMVFVNPQITKLRGEEAAVEGCLSCEEIDDRLIIRAKIINWVAQDLDGKLISGKMSGYIARVFQHELDHLNGILILDKQNEKWTNNSRVVLK